MNRTVKRISTTSMVAVSVIAMSALAVPASAGETSELCVIGPMQEVDTDAGGPIQWLASNVVYQNAVTLPQWQSIPLGARQRIRATQMDVVNTGTVPVYDLAVVLPYAYHTSTTDPAWLRVPMTWDEAAGTFLLPNPTLGVDTSSNANSGSDGVRITPLDSWPGGSTTLVRRSQDDLGLSAPYVDAAAGASPGLYPNGAAVGNATDTVPVYPGDAEVAAGAPASIQYAYAVDQLLQNENTLPGFTVAARLVGRLPQCFTATISDPASVTVPEGGTATFDAAVTTTPADQDVEITWEYSDDGVTWVAVPGASGSTLVVSNATTDLDGRLYRAVGTGALSGVVRSEAALLTVTVTPTPTPTPDPSSSSTAPTVPTSSSAPGGSLAESGVDASIPMVAGAMAIGLGLLGIRRRARG